MPESYSWSREEESIKSSLMAFKLFRVKQNLPMLLSLRRAYAEERISRKEFIKVVAMMESFHFIFNAITQQRSSGSIATLYSKHAIALSLAQNHSEIQSVFSALKSDLRYKLPSFETFSEGFKGLGFINRYTKHKNIIKYILGKFLGNEANGLSIRHDRMTLEHLLSQSNLDETNRKDISSIGNLILIDEKTNSEKLRNKEFKVKKEILLEEKVMY